METLKGIGVMIVLFIILWLCFGDDDLPHVFRIVFLPLIIVACVIVGGGYLIGHYLLPLL